MTVSSRHRMLTAGSMFYRAKRSQRVAIYSPQWGSLISVFEKGSCMRSAFVAAGSLLLASLCLLLLAPLSFGQGANATITGTVTDPTGLPVAGANVEARNTETGAVYTAASTSAGNYAITNLPVGTYELTVTVSGFKTYAHQNLAMAAAQVLREDISLEVGATTDSITVEAQASLLKAETGELGDNVTVEQMVDSPLLGIGTVNSGTSGVRNPYNVLQTLPGVTGYNAGGTVGGPMVVNGLGGAQPNNGFTVSLTETMRIEGQDATSQIFGNYVYTQMAQPNADAIQEIAFQTSNYAPEVGQAGTAVINMTMKSGTNQYHGTGFDYFVNEFLNAGDPFTVNTDGTGKVTAPKPPQRFRRHHGRSHHHPQTLQREEQDLLLLRL